MYQCITPATNLIHRCSIICVLVSQLGAVLICSFFDIISCIGDDVTKSTEVKNVSVLSPTLFFLWIKEYFYNSG